MPVVATVPLADVVLTGNDTAVIVSNIPSTYQDLYWIVSPKAASGTHGGRIRFNATTSDYAVQQIYWNGAGTRAAQAFTGTGIVDLAATTTPSTSTGIIFNYSQGKNKCVISTGGRVNGINSSLSFTRWTYNNAINSIEFNLQGIAFTAGSRFQLFGIKG